MMGGAALLGAGALYLIFKPADAAASPKPGSPTPPTPGTPATKKCPDGSTVPTAATCPASPSGCSAAPSTPVNAPVPSITVLAQGVGAPTGPLAVPGNLTALPASAVGGGACATGPDDALVFLQAWDAASGFQPVFQDPGPAPAVAYAITAAGVKGTDKAVDPVAVFGTKSSYVANYFDPAMTPLLSKIEAPGTIVLIWSTTTAGKPLAWWITSWAPPKVMT
jgi:hypothetical protein